MDLERLKPGDRIVCRYNGPGTWHGTVPGKPTHHIVSWDNERRVVMDHSPAFWTPEQGRLT